MFNEVNFVATFVYQVSRRLNYVTNIGVVALHVRLSSQPCVCVCVCVCGAKCCALTGH